MPYAIYANDQSFQSIYLDLNADDWNDVIVFHEPMFDDEIPGVIALKSFRLEDCIGFVLAAPRNILRHYKEKVKDLDKEQRWGKLDTQKIIDNMISLAVEMGCTVSYKQLGEYDKNTDKADLGFFDPVTKRRIVEKGPHHFDPSLVTLEDVEEETKDRQTETDRELEGASTRIYSPSTYSFPKGISQEGKSLWRQIMDRYREQIYSHESCKKRWEVARFLYDSYCKKIGIEPFRVKPKYVPSEIIKKLTGSNTKVRDYLDLVHHALYGNKFVGSKIGPEKVKEVKLQGDYYFLITTREVALEGLATANKVIDFLESEFNFELLKTEKLSAYTKVDGHTILTYSEDKAKPRHMQINITFGVLTDDAQTLYDLKESSKIQLALLNALYRWVKTKKLTLKSFIKKI